MERPLWEWGVFFAVFLGVLVFDLAILNRTDHVVKMRESLKLSAIYCLIAFLFGGWIWWVEGAESSGLFLTGYLVEQSLSMDNIFVISLVLNYFAVPRPYQHRVLFWGIFGVIVMRALMIGVGVAVISNFQWVLLIFAAFLVFTGAKMLLMDDEEEHNIKDNAVVKFFEKRMRVTHELHGHNFTVKQKDKKTGKMVLYFTPLMIALCVVEVVDIIFAVDSIPAILAITQDTFLVYTSNLFAIMGLRALYFTLSAMLDRFQYLKYALSVVLIFIGLKVLAHKGMEQAGEWAGHFDKGLGETISSYAFHISPAVSLAITLGTLIAGGLFSLHKTKEEGTEEVKLGGFSAFPSMLSWRKKRARKRAKGGE
ncbi:MAG: TerC family protein [Alphaproteobacteria bacterium]|nr:MAG: TerC family protein [Alphaproteobacteria bacterium]